MFGILDKVKCYPIRTKTKVVKKAEDLPTGKYFIREKSSNKYFTADFKSKEFI